MEASSSMTLIRALVLTALKATQASTASMMRQPRDSSSGWVICQLRNSPRPRSSIWSTLQRRLTPFKWFWYNTEIILKKVLIMTVYKYRSIPKALQGAWCPQSEQERYGRHDDLRKDWRMDSDLCPLQNRPSVKGTLVDWISCEKSSAAWELRLLSSLQDLS